MTYCVGGLSLCNSIAGAYAEKSPVIVISGAPGMEERRSDPLLHHRVKDFNTQREVFEKIDLLATPATPVTAGRIDKGDLQSTFSLIHNTNPLNLLGIPAISVPCGFTSSGLPIGLQLAGRWWDEATVLRAAHAYERATEWHKRHPPR